MTGNEGTAERPFGERETDVELHALRASWAFGREERQRSSVAAVAAGREPATTSPTVTVERRSASACLVRLTGVLDAYNAPELGLQLNGLIEDGAERFVIDLRDTTLLDSSGLGALLAALLRLRERNGQLALLAGPRSVMQGFRLTGLDGVFRIFAGEAEALALLDAD
jgi:anti-anti-sigma factor